MTIEEVQEMVQTTSDTVKVVQECVQLRKEAKEPVTELAKWLDIDRRKIATFEKGNFDYFLAEKILNYYGKILTLKTQHNK